MASRVLQALRDVALHLPAARRNPLEALDLLTPHSTSRVRSDLSYGAHGGQRADLYLPDGARSVVVFFHGGRWSYGHKEEYRFVGEALAARGLAALVCDYRKYPAFRFPAFVEDAAAAIAWAMTRLPDLGIDRRQVFAMGHSAGAHIAALATMDRRYAEVHGIDPDSLAGLVLLSGPYDFYPIREADLRDMFGPDEFHHETQPLRYVRPGLPPFLLLHGRRDRTVRPSSSARLASALRSEGVEARAIFYEHLTHTNILAALSGRIGFLVAPLLEDVDAFVRRRIRRLRADEGS